MYIIRWNYRLILTLLLNGGKRLGGISVPVECFFSLSLSLSFFFFFFFFSFLFFSLLVGDFCISCQLFNVFANGNVLVESFLNGSQ